MEVTCSKVAIRTKGDGHWKKYTYQGSEWTVTLSGLLAFDDDNWTGWDMIDNQLNFSHILIRCSFTNTETGDIETIQGLAMVETSTLSWSPGQLVKDDFQLQGNGAMIKFDGLIPCDTTITDITISGQTAEDGIVHFDYTFTGPVYQVKYRIDGIGDYAYATAGPTIDVPGLPIGNHTVEIIPICINGYEGIGREERFQVTQGNTCGSSIDSIAVDTTAFTIANIHSGTATQMRYRIDGGTWIGALITAVISISGIDPGDHMVEMVPVCGNGVEGTGLTQDFTIVSQPITAQINWSLDIINKPDNLQIYVNGTLYENDHTDSSGLLTVPAGAIVRAVMIGVTGGLRVQHIRLHVKNQSTGEDLYDQSSLVTGFTTVTEQFTFTADGGTIYNIDGIVT